MDFQYNEIERMFTQDVIDKKRAGSGAFKRKGKGVKHGMRGIRFPSDSLTAAQKKKLNGEMIVVSGLGVKLNKEEFLANTQEKQKEILEHWRKLYSSKEIQEFLDIDKNTYYKFLYELGILEKPASYVGASQKPINVPTAKIPPISLGSTNTTSTAQTEGKRRGKPINDLPDATSNTIISYDDFKELDTVERLVYLDEIYAKYNTRSVAEVWGMSLNNLYNVKHQIKIRLEKLKEKEEKSNLKNQNIQNESESVDDNVHQLEMDEINSQQEVVVPQETVDNVQVPQAVPNQSEVAMSEINMLKEMVQQQNSLIQGIISMQQSMQQEVAATTIPAATSIEQLSPVPHNPVLPTVDKKSNNMEFSFVDEKEGFMLYQDIKRFIAVLEKNPDLFEVEIKVRRKDQ